MFRIAISVWLLVVMTAGPLSRADVVDSTALDPQWLAATRESDANVPSRGIRPEEAEGYFAILNHARQVSSKQLRDEAKRFESERLAVVRNDPALRFYFRRAEAEFPTFVDLHRSPAAYRGQPVTLRGHMRRLIELPPGPNPFGFERLYEAWLYVDDAQQNPVVVVCSELPPGLSTGSDVLVDFVSATGYFFKRYGYSDQAGQWRFAPLILAGRLDWSPRAERTAWLSSATMWWLVCGGGVLVLWLGWRAIRLDRARPVGSESQPTNWAVPSIPPTAPDIENPDRCGSD